MCKKNISFVNDFFHVLSKIEVVIKNIVIIIKIKMSIRSIINIQKIVEIPSSYPNEFLQFCAVNLLKPPAIGSKNGKALVTMLHYKEYYFNRDTCNEFVKKFNIETKDSIQLFNKHEQWGIATSKKKSIYYVDYPYHVTNKPKMRKNFKYGGTNSEKNEEIEKIKSIIKADYIDVPIHLWQLGHKNPNTDDNTSTNLVLQPPIQAKYRDNYIFIDTLTKFPTPKHLKNSIDNNDICLTSDQIKEYFDVFKILVENQDTSNDLSDALQRSLQI
uniref:Uncharacterized protein n=1 Tax=viral metagenome TaxID=1070528 RepID=A0A6C0BRF6_9ZZZZ